MLLYDVTNERSFLSVRQWIDAVDVSKIGEHLSCICRLTIPSDPLCVSRGSSKRREILCS